MRRLPQLRAPGATSGAWFDEAARVGGVTGEEAVVDSVAAPIA